MTARRAWRTVVVIGTALAAAGALHARHNARLLRRAAAEPGRTGDTVHVLVPARDEAARLPATLRGLDAQAGPADLRITVLDDGSTDGTGPLLAAWARNNPAADIVHGADTAPPPGWLGKPWACSRLAECAPSATALVFVDADVTLEPTAVAAAVALLRGTGAALVSPWPRQLAGSPVERLLQPIQQWSWLTTLPLGVAERSGRPSMVAANGQFLVVDAAAYRAIGGHGAVRAEVVEDIAIARALRAAGYRTVVADGSTMASCRMYGGAHEVRAGYRKSLWAAFGPATAPLPRLLAAAIAVQALLATAYVVPAAAAVIGPGGATRLIGAAGYAAGVAGRVVAARATGSPVWPDALAHPVSILLVAGLTADSFLARARGTARWKGRAVTPAAAP